MANALPRVATCRGKRMLDIVGAGTLAVALSPVMAIVAVAVRLAMGRPVLFVQERPGFDSRIIRVHKFRTMVTSPGRGAPVTADTARLTSLGRWLRMLSLDELPQLFDVLRGEMSLVGPRPLLVQYLDLYSDEQRRRQLAKPGITGWAQVNGRNALAWSERLALDVWYVDNWSMGLDLRILELTAIRVLRRQGISATGMATVAEFQGQET